MLLTLLVRLSRGRYSASPDVVQQNIRNLYLEVFFAGLMQAVVSFNSAYVIRLGASNEMVGLLTSLPALVTAIASIPSARFMQGRRKPCQLAAR